MAKYCIPQSLIKKGCLGLGTHYQNILSIIARFMVEACGKGICNVEGQVHASL